MPIDPLPPTALFTRCDTAAFDFETTDALEAIGDSLGQARAVEAVRFGIEMRSPGYNLFALGPPGTGKHTLLRRYLNEAAKGAKAPSDWVYVNNFEEPHRPKALELPSGRGWPLRDDMDRLVAELREAIPAMFESDAYRTRREALDQEFQSQQEKSFEEVQAHAKEKNIAIMRTQMGLAMAPLRDGKVLEPDAFAKLPEEEQAQTRTDIEALEQELQEVMRKAPQWMRSHREQLHALNREMTEYVVGHVIDELKKRYEDLPKVAAHIEAVRRDVIENAHDFVPQPDGENDPEAMARRAATGAIPGAGEAAFRRYRVNVIVDHAGNEAAPVVYEDHPTHPNLLGRIEHIAQFGALLTDFNLIKPGALLRANGGYLMIDALKLLQQPYAWEELKRALRSGEVKIEGMAEALGVASTVSLQPQPIRLNVKVVLLGDRQLYYMLSAYDPDFGELFKVAADFDDVVDRTADNTQDYARMIATLAKRDRLLPLDRGAVGRVIEHAARIVEDSEKLSARIRLIVDLLHETDHFSRQAGVTVTSAEHVQTAIDAQVRRADRVRSRVHEQIVRGTVMIDTEGKAVGQLNGLSVLQMGGFAFGQPSRITARVRMGRGEVVDIEREVELGGPLHSKGVLILSGFLGQRFARNRPLALSASLVFEQSYGGVDGDSASSAELYALLSALSGVPLGQNFAVTGSVNQHGQVQPIGGANEKIEGFFDICNARGLTGEQGVLIPATNVKHLMLRGDVVKAVEDGRFRIFAVETIDQGIEILTGVAAGEADANGVFPPDSVNGKVQATLDGFAEAARAFAKGDDK
jgi:lon-related putative ATP-dependent protease